MYHEQPCVNVQVEPRRSITKKSNLAHLLSLRATFHTGGGGGVLPYMGYIGMRRCEGYGFHAVYSRIGYINQSVWV